VCCVVVLLCVVVCMCSYLHKGFAVGGFGAGSIVWSKVFLILEENIGIPQTFATVGAVFFVVEMISTIALRTPPNDFDVSVFSHNQVCSPLLNNILTYILAGKNR
jgi:hypothetical protein